MALNIETKQGRAIDIFARAHSAERPVGLDVVTTMGGIPGVCSDLTLDEAKQVRDGLTQVIAKVEAAQQPVVGGCVTFDGEVGKAPLSGFEFFSKALTEATTFDATECCEAPTVDELAYAALSLTKAFVEATKGGHYALSGAIRPVLDRVLAKIK